jgi:cobalt-zinc-cadmium efflux system membrane fusion protein
VLDPDNKVMKVRVALTNNDMLLKPEMFTNVLITNKEASSSVAIPASAVIFDEQQKLCGGLQQQMRFTGACGKRNKNS